MRLVKMSLLAATLVASSAFAIDNVKFDGDAKLFYSTNDSMDPSYTNDPDASLFRKENSAGQAALGLGATADLAEGVAAGVHMTALSSLGLYNNLVENVWEGTAEDEFWFDEAWIAGTVGKTTGKVGRMALDTPLVFSETWSIASNTFEAAVVTNEDIPDTMIVGAYIGQSNGGGAKSGYAGVTNDFTADGVEGASNTNFESFHEGAYAIGAVNNSWEPLTVQAWYYQAQHLLSAFWLQGDLSMMGLDFGLQYAGLQETAALSDESNDAFAGKVGYTMKDTFAVSVAFSQTGDKATDLNVGANLDGYGQSKLYTEAWWNYGYVTAADTTAFTVTATTPEELTWVALGAYITQATSKDAITVTSTGEVVDNEMFEVTLEAAKSFGSLDAGIYYIFTDSTGDNVEAGADEDAGEASNTVQVYLTYNF